MFPNATTPSPDSGLNFSLEAEPANITAISELLPSVSVKYKCPETWLIDKSEISPLTAMPLSLLSFFSLKDI